MDLPRVRAVLNVDGPSDLRSYLHRAGRTARAGRAGVVVTFLEPEDCDTRASNVIEALFARGVIPTVSFLR